MHIRDYVGKHIHFIGIGGISMSALASILLQRGYVVSGSDMHASPLIDKLIEHGATCYIGHAAGQEAGAALVVFSAAIPPTNPERVAADAAGIPSIDRATLLGELMEEYQQSVGVAGTHGKTTTSSILATILELAGKDPTIHIGGELPLIGGAMKLGGHGIFVTEACEYKDSFLKLHPTCAVVLNIDSDHLDYFADIDAIERSFETYVGLLPEDGKVVGNGDDPRVWALMQRCGKRHVSFGFQDHNDYQAVLVQDADGLYNFCIQQGVARIARVQLSVPGRHNIYNAMAALLSAAYCGVPIAEGAPHVAAYTGARRRFEKAGMCLGAQVFHDYAHHPAEIRATLAAARDMCASQVWCIFQPHTYSRTKLLFEEFVRSFDVADHLILLDIYAAREADPGDIHAQDLAAAIGKRGANKSVRYATTFGEAAGMVKAGIQPGDLVLTLGAGDIESISALIIDA